MPLVKRFSRVFGLLAALGLGTLGAAPAAAQVPFEQMESHTLRIFAAIVTQEGESLGGGSGTGFMLAGNHVATNAHVAFDADFLAQTGADPRLIEALRSGAAQILYFVVLGREEDEWIEGRIVQRSTEQDLAVLELAESIDRPAVSLLPEANVHLGDDVYAFGFPGAADRGSIDDFSPSVTRGLISRFVQDQSGWRLYQTDAAINPGNSGGPLFDACGQLVGINVQKALTMVFDAEGNPVRVPEGEAIGWAIRADELMELLDQLNITYETAASACAVSTTTTVVARDPWVLVGLGAAILLGLLAVILAATARGRAAVKQTVHTIRRTTSGRYGAAPPPPKVVPKTKPVLRALGGPYKGSTLDLGAEPLTIGRDPRVSQLVYPADTQSISKRHCILTYDAARRVFSLEDCWSTNGTYLASGEALKPGEARTLHAGARFYLGDREHLYEVQLVT